MGGRVPNEAKLQSLRVDLDESRTVGLLIFAASCPGRPKPLENVEMQRHSSAAGAQGRNKVDLKNQTRICWLKSKRNVLSRLSGQISPRNEDQFKKFALSLRDRLPRREAAGLRFGGGPGPPSMVDKPVMSVGGADIVRDNVQHPGDGYLVRRRRNTITLEVSRQVR
jgi:hypothetical protein